MIATMLEGHIFWSTHASVESSHYDVAARFTKPTEPWQGKLFQDRRRGGTVWLLMRFNAETHVVDDDMNAYAIVTPADLHCSRREAERAYHAELLSYSNQLSDELSAVLKELRSLLTNGSHVGSSQLP